MAIYYVPVEIKEASGIQTYTVEANSPEDAIKKFKNGDGAVIFEEIDAESLEEPNIEDVYED